MRQFPTLTGPAIEVLVILALAGCQPASSSSRPAEPLGTTGPSSIPTANPASYPITNFEGVKVTLTLPIGWTGYGLYVNNGGGAATTLTGIEVWAVDQTYTDPCHWDGAELDPPLGPTVDDLATALQNQPTREATTSDVTVDGYSGSLVKMIVPAGAVLAECDEGEFRSWTWGSDSPRWAQGPGQHDDVYILDVEGFRLVIDTIYYDSSPATDRAEQLQMVDNAQIEPPV
jgi:hypothetical protein